MVANGSATHARLTVQIGPIEAEIDLLRSFGGTMPGGGSPIEEEEEQCVAVQMDDVLSTGSAQFAEHWEMITCATSIRWLKFLRAHTM